MILIFELVFTPGGSSLEGLETVHTDAFDPLIGIVLLALSGVLIFKVRMGASSPTIFVTGFSSDSVCLFFFNNPPKDLMSDLCLPAYLPPPSRWVWVPATKGVKDLGNSLTPFPKPRSDNILKTDGAYKVVRHPMYSGLAFGGFGLAIVTGSPVRIIYAVCLAALLNFKAASEEEYLSKMHGKDTYDAYAAKTPRLIPNVQGLGELLEDTFDGSFSEEGKK